MTSTIKYGKNFNDTLHKILKTRTYENITLKCTYPEYFSIILNNTPLPEVLINIICEWTNDKIVLQIKPDSTTQFNVESKEMCINFIHTQFNFSNYSNNLCDMFFCENILKFDEEIHMYDKRMYTKLIYYDVMGHFSIF